MAGTEKAERINLTLTLAQKNYLDDLVNLGIHGRTVSEVARTLLSREIERLISEGFLEIKHTSPPQRK